MKGSLYMLAVLGLVGCSGADKDSGGGETTAKCETKVNKTIPATGASDFYYRGYVEFQLSEADDTAKVTSDIAGTQTMSDDGKTIYYTPSAPLEPDTSYTVTLTYCGGVVPLDFTTSSLGKDIEPSVLVGKTFALDLAKANIVEPAGVGAALSSLLTTKVLAGVVSADASKVQMIGAIATDGTTDQDFCNPSIPFPEADFTEAPYFKIGPADTTLSISGAEILVQDLEITGTFASDATSFGGGTLKGTIDARDIAAALPDLGYDAAGLCDLIAGFGASCVACSDQEPYCLGLVADSIVADGVSGTLMEVADKDCPGCEDGAPVCPM